MNVVELHPTLTCENIVAGLRVLADEIEAGEYDIVPTLAVVVLGEEGERKDRDGITEHFNWRTHGFGKGSYFSWKGLLASAMQTAEP